MWFGIVVRSTLPRSLIDPWKMAGFALCWLSNALCRILCRPWAPCCRVVRWLPRGPKRYYHEELSTWRWNQRLGQCWTWIHWVHGWVWRICLGSVNVRSSRCLTLILTIFWGDFALYQLVYGDFGNRAQESASIMSDTSAFPPVGLESCYQCLITAPS